MAEKYFTMHNVYGHALRKAGGAFGKLKEFFQAIMKEYPFLLFRNLATLESTWCI